MARMIPPEPPPRATGTKAERELWDALHHGLSDEYIVYYSLGLLERERAQEGEVDFLVLHRTRGLLVIECKGGGVRRRSDGRWVRQAPNGREELMRHSPFEQAQGQIKSLVKELRIRMHGMFSDRFPFVHGHAVALPFAANIDEALPLDAQREIVLTSRDLERVDVWVERAFAFWARAAGRLPEPLSPADFRRFQRQILHPELRLVETLGSRFTAEAASIARLTEEQVMILRGCVGMKRCRIAGGAGTGKTALALEAAKRFAREAEKGVLLICYNKMLAAHLAAKVESWGSIDGKIDVTTFHALCHRAYGALGLAYEPPQETDKERSRRFWNDEAPEALLEALAADALERYDAIIVDEAQDFQADWTRVLEESLHDTKTGRIVFFFDPAQKIFERATGLTAAPPTYTLTTNFRNAKAIAGFVRDLGGVDMTPHPRAPDGEAPRVHPLAGPAKTKTRLDELVRTLVESNRVSPNQFAFLTPHRRENSSLRDLTEIGGIPLAETLDARDGKVLHATIGAFKGLESDVVILVDVDPSDERCDRRTRYVGASRAKLALHVFARGDWMAA